MIETAYFIAQLRECLYCQSKCFPYHVFDRENAYLVYWSCSNDDCRRTFRTYESEQSFSKISKHELDDYAAQAGIRGLAVLVEESKVCEEVQ